MFQRTNQDSTKADNRSAAMMVAACGAVAAAGGTASADIVRPDASGYAVASGGSVSFDAGVRVGGSVVSAGRFSGGSGVTVGGNVFGGEASFGSDTSIGGSVFSDGYTYFGSRSSVAGGINVVGEASFGSDGSYGSVFATGPVSMSSASFFDGSVNSGSSVWADSGVRITGDVRYTTTQWMNHTAWVGGTVATGADAPDTWQNSVVMASSPAPSGGSGVWTNSVANVAPGTYGSVWAANGSTVAFTSGSYAFSSVGGGQNITMTFDTTAGDIIVTTTSDFSINSGVRFDVVGDGSVTVVAGGRIWFGSGAEVEGTFIAGREFSMDANGVVNGTVYGADNVWIGADSVVTGGNVPAPGAAAVFGVVGVFAARRRRG